MKTVVVTGANRGIGFALTNELAARQWNVIATSRGGVIPPVSGNVSHRRLDVADPMSIENFARDMAATPIDMLVNNAGVYHRTAALVPFDRDAWDATLAVNLSGAVHLTAALIPSLLLAPTRKIIAISSALGSIAGAFGGSNAYRSSKAGLNMAMRNLAIEMEPLGFIVASISPGAVDTAMARDVPVPKITPQESAAAVIDRIEALTMEESGAFMRHSGESLDW